MGWGRGELEEQCPQGGVEGSSKDPQVGQGLCVGTTTTRLDSVTWEGQEDANTGGSEFSCQKGTGSSQYCSLESEVQVDVEGSIHRSRDQELDLASKVTS